MSDQPSSTRLAENDPDGTPTQNVVPMTYAQLRLLAECAAGSTGITNFISTRGASLEVLATGVDTEVRDYDILIPASNVGTRYPANVFMLRADGAADMRRAVPAGFADAVFWSDAAVQKFVFPYVASCGGIEAVQVLQQLQQAWNFYPADQVTVYALVHMVHFDPDVPLSLAKAFCVAYREADTAEDSPLRMMRLDEFLNDFPSSSLTISSMPLSPDDGTITTTTTFVPAEPTEWIRYHRGLSGPLRGAPLPTPDYTSLRAMAEWAASVRGAPQYFVCLAGETSFTLQTGFPDVGPGDLVVPVQTPTLPDGRPPLGAMWFQAEGADETVNLAALRSSDGFPGDALFWSTGAIDQFMAPYYMSKVGLANVSQLQTLADAWLDSSQAPAGETVVGLIHLYTSEWIEEMAAQGTPVPGPDPTLEIGVLSVDDSGAHQIRPVRDFLAPRAG